MLCSDSMAGSHTKLGNEIQSEARTFSDVATSREDSNRDVKNNIYTSMEKSALKNRSVDSWKTIA